MGGAFNKTPVTESRSSYIHMYNTQSVKPIINYMVEDKNKEANYLDI